MQYAAAEGLVTPLFRTPHSLPVAYKAAVIAVTCLGGCLVLLSLALALLARKQQSSPEGVHTLHIIKFLSVSQAKLDVKQQGYMHSQLQQCIHDSYSLS